jgi:hypothetical protein
MVKTSLIFFEILEKKLRDLMKYKVLIIDEIGGSVAKNIRISM